MKTLLAVALLFLIPASVFSQTLVWQTPATENPAWVHSADNGNVYAAYAHTLYKLDANGAQIWSTPLGSSGLEYFSAGQSGVYVLYGPFGSTPNVAYVSNAGTLSWSRALSGVVGASVGGEHCMYTDNADNLIVLYRALNISGQGSSYLTKLDLAGNTVFDMQLPVPKLKGAIDQAYNWFLLDSQGRSWAICNSTTHSGNDINFTENLYVDLLIIGADGKTVLKSRISKGVSATGKANGSQTQGCPFYDGMQMGGLYRGLLVLGTTDAKEVFTVKGKSTKTEDQSSWLVDMVTDRGGITTFSYKSKAGIKMADYKGDGLYNSLTSISVSNDGIYLTGTVAAVSNGNLSGVQTLLSLEPISQTAKWIVNDPAIAPTTFYPHLNSPGLLAATRPLNPNSGTNLCYYNMTNGKLASSFVFGYDQVNLGPGAWSLDGSSLYAYANNDFRQLGPIIFKFSIVPGGSSANQPGRVEENSGKPSTYALQQNYPNPFNPTTTISYQLVEDAHVTLKIYNALGQEVRILVNEMQTAGNKSAVFDANGLSSGVYFYRLTAGTFTDMKKMVIAK